MKRISLCLMCLIVLGTAGISFFGGVLVNKKYTAKRLKSLKSEVTEVYKEIATGEIYVGLSRGGDKPIFKGWLPVKGKKIIAYDVFPWTEPRKKLGEFIPYKQTGFGKELDLGRGEADELWDEAKKYMIEAMHSQDEDVRQQLLNKRDQLINKAFNTPLSEEQMERLSKWMEELIEYNNKGLALKNKHIEEITIVDEDTF